MKAEISLYNLYLKEGKHVEGIWINRQTIEWDSVLGCSHTNWVNTKKRLENNFTKSSLSH